jgi:hypothetical protein
MYEAIAGPKHEKISPDLPLPMTYNLFYEAGIRVHTCVVKMARNFRLLFLSSLR